LICHYSLPKLSTSTTTRDYVGNHSIRSCMGYTLGLSVAGEHQKEKKGEHCRPGLGKMVALFFWHNH
jgi:hypothetical protein